MKITKIELFHIHLPLKTPFVVSYETYDIMPSMIAKIHTDNGLIGYGEGVPDAHVTGEDITGSYELLKQKIAPALIGHNPLNITKIHAVMDSIIVGNPALKATVDLACYDLIGKNFKAPLYKILGGKTKELLEYAKVISIGDQNYMLKEVDRALEEGFNILKLKVGRDKKQDIENIQMIRKYVPDYIEVRVDVNQGWDSMLTTKEAEALMGVAWLEQPFGIDDYMQHKELKNILPIPLMLDETIKSTKELKLAMHFDAVDAINVKLMKTGGIFRAQKLITTAEAFDIPCQIGSMVESSLGSAAGYHLAMAMKNVTSTELTGPILFSKDIGNLKYSVPYVLLSDDPGLGVTVDEDALQSLTIKKDVIVS